MTFEELAALRAKGDPLARYLESQLRGYLETLRRLLAPRRLLGQHVHSAGKEDVVGADQALAALKKEYAQVCAKPFGLPAEWDEAPLQGISGRLELYPWEYTQQVPGPDGATPVTMTAPAQWVLMYRSGYTLSELREALAQKGQRRADDIRQFVVDALVLNTLIAKSPGLKQLVVDLRYKVRTMTAPDLGTLPLTTISACIPSIRPPDELILTAIRFSGVPAFFEVLDIDAVQTLADPLKEQLTALLR